MLAITCDKCRRRYSATDEELLVYLNDAESKKFIQILCPHCGKPSKVATDRIHQALRFSPVAADTASAAGPGAAGDGAGRAASDSEQSSTGEPTQKPVEPSLADTLPTADREQTPPNSAE